MTQMTLADDAHQQNHHQQQQHVRRDVTLRDVVQRDVTLHDVIDRDVTLQTCSKAVSETENRLQRSATDVAADNEAHGDVDENMAPPPYDLTEV